MNQADILKLAEAIFTVQRTGGYSRIFAENQCKYDGNCNADITEELTDFAELVAQHEREQNDLEIRRLQAIIDSRPAINAGLPSTYIEWSQQIYALDVLSAKGDMQ